MSASDAQRLRSILQRIDGRGYKAYGDIRGRHDLSDMTLFVDRVQGDPFAAPSRVRVRLDQREARFPPSTWENPQRAVGLRCLLADRFAEEARDLSRHAGSGKSGLIDIMAPGQEILESTAVVVNADMVEARFTVGLPARGRRVLGRQAERLLLEAAPEAARRALRADGLDMDEVEAWCDVAEDASALREMLPGMGLVAFVADGAILPRRSGVDERPMSAKHAVPFRSPDSMRVEVDLPSAGRITGMGIPTGVTLVVGGGFHGKSCLLSAIERGVWAHRPGDGREHVVSLAETVKIRAEEGRRVEGVDISPFISNLPGGQETTRFRTENASGSTSQAANIVEALEAGARCLLIDEDTAATNFMIRDHRMQELVSKDREPITPFIDRARRLRDLGVSTILVIGGSGDYFDVADRVVALDAYVPDEVTDEARAIAERWRTVRATEGGDAFGEPTPRRPDPRSLDARKGRRQVSVKVRDLHHLQFGEEDVDLTAVTQLVHRGQTRAIGSAMVLARERHMDGRRTLAEVLDRVMDDLERSGLECLARDPVGDLAHFRRFDLAAAINRLRSLKTT